MRCGVCCSGHLSATYRASQTDPVRIALMDDSAQRDAGKGYWRLEDLVSAYSCRSNAASRTYRLLPSLTVTTT